MCGEDDEDDDDEDVMDDDVVDDKEVIPRTQLLVDTSPPT